MSSERAYDTSDLATLRQGPQRSENRELLFKIYDQTCSTWRQLVDVRFKLLALVPVTSIGSLVAAMFSGAHNPKLPVLFIAAFGGIGLLATLGLWIYDRRNSDLYDDLISRARKIEEELGLCTGPFLGRLRSRNRLMNHSTGINLVYAASFLAWLSVLALLFVN